MDLFDLENESVLNSRDSSFPEKIGNLTDYRGVDIVLDPFLDERCEASWECLSPVSRFLDISQGDYSGPKFPQTGLLKKNVSHNKIDPSSLILVQPELISESFDKASALISEGLLQAPGPIHVFPASRVDDAFQSLQNRDQVGKTVLSFSRNDILQVRSQLSGLVKSMGVSLNQNTNGLILAQQIHI